ncbi:MAG: tRNA-guanine transglycosylase [uncultured Acidilobus sp. OSP8]|jgi:archaeosine tRNA-ribosyltransferase (EC 2.4.2.-)|nr:MAG: tRNA-guanine transglycosylase [uncultured Acidilobus sp. OSP8]
MTVFKVRDFELAGRIGTLITKGGQVETPAFFPVIDPIRQEVSISDIEEVGFRQVITNAYLLYKRFGDRAREEGVHRILNFNGTVMTDSGAYQLLEYGEIDIDQDTIIGYERDIGSDIAVILDHPTGDVSRAEAEESVKKTLENAISALKLIGSPEESKTVWVLPIQGGRYLDLVARSAEESSKLPYPMYALGSPTVFMEKYKYSAVLDMLGTAKLRLPPERPLHLFGAGHPLMFPFAVALGADTFDSASYVLYARDDRYMTDYGTVRLQELEYFPCSCPVCSKYTPKDLLEMPPAERRRLLALHNLYVIKRSIERVKQAMREGRLWELLVEISRYRPEAREALRTLSKYYKLLEEYTSRSKGSLRGLRLISIESVWNPRVMRYRSWAASRYAPYAKRVLLRPLLSSAGRCTSEKPGSKDLEVIYYMPYLGLVPASACGAYPTAQHRYSGVVDDDVIRDLVNFVRAFIARVRRMGYEVSAEATYRRAWSVEVGRELERMGVSVTWLGPKKRPT